MVVVNDSPLVKYEFEHPNVQIFNLDERFNSITTKLKWAYQNAKYDYLYRLDDDDLLTPWALNSVKEDILAHPEHDIYRSSQHYFFIDNKFNKLSSNVNNGNVYTRKYFDRIEWPCSKSGEDGNLTFSHGGKIYTSKKRPTMLYRWGMNIHHVSGLGVQTNAETLANTDKRIKKMEEGIIKLQPKFLNDYYSQLPK